MKYKLSLIFISLMFLFTLSCDSEGENGGEFSYPHPDQAEWIYTFQAGSTSTSPYSVYDEHWVLNGTYDHPYGGTTQILEYYMYNSSSQEWERWDTWYMLVTSEEVRFYPNSDSGIYGTLLKFPLSVGKEWDTGYIYNAESAKVVGQEDVTTPAGIFNNCYKVEYYAKGFTQFTVWFPSGVGCWGAKTDVVGWGTLTLHSYNLPS